MGKFKLYLQSVSHSLLHSQICSEKELRSGIVVTDGEVPKEAAEEHDETKFKGKEVGNQLLVFEIPMHPSMAHPNQVQVTSCFLQAVYLFPGFFILSFGTFSSILHDNILQPNMKCVFITRIS